MNLLLYSNGGGRAEKKIKKALAGVISEESIESYHRVENLLSRLRRRTYDVGTVILMADKRTLSVLSAEKDMLTRLRTILILPDADENTVTAAHQLYPRFITYFDGDLQDVAEVLRKMNHNP